MTIDNPDIATPATASARPPRWQLLDILRGVAILAMIVFHVAWDLYYFGYSNVDVTSDPGWVAFQKVILSSFLLLVGAGLVLGHGDGIRWRRFWWRFAFVVVAALLVSIGTYIQFPDYFVFFGVLHAIALFSLIGLAFLRLNPWLTVAIGVAVIAANFAWNDPVFSSRELGWIGFWPVSPPTSDVVPVFPWLGVTLLGIAGMRLLRASALGTRLAAWRSAEPAAKGLAFIGRWSLLIYLLHQPSIIGGFNLLALVQPTVLAPPVLTSSERFVSACTNSCGTSGNDAGYCQRLCQCALEQAEPAGLVDIDDVADLTPEQRTELDAISALCQSMAATP
jgi:uncharacterized membrane protein